MELGAIIFKGQNVSFKFGEEFFWGKMFRLTLREVYSKGRVPLIGDV